MRGSTAMLLFLFAIFTNTTGQVTRNIYEELELIGGIGTTHYFGDIGGSRGDLIGVAALFDNLGLDVENSRLATRLGARYAFNKSMAVSVHLSPMFYYGSDERSSKAYRGYWFDTYILAFTAQYEYYFANRLTGYSPYGFAGLGGLAYWVDANHFPSKKMNEAMDITMGFGMRFPTRSKLTHSVELGFHYYLTDRLDGLQGALKRNDTGFTLLYMINFEWLANFIYDHRGLIRR